MNTFWRAEGSVIKGDVDCGENVSIWYNATIRGDIESITIGDNTNIQDNVVIHVDVNYKTTIGDNVTVGHSAVLHGCTIGNNTVIGMGAIILNGAKIGNNCIVGAGTLITQNKEIPDGSLVYGNPAQIIRPLTEEEIKQNTANAQWYVEEARYHLPRLTDD